MVGAVVYGLKMNRWMSFAASLCLLLAACAPSVYSVSYPVEAVTLPRDEAAHRAPIEWWYYTGHVTDETGHEYGFELTFFKAYTPPGIKLFGFLPADALVDKGHVAHFAMTDVDGQRFEKAERTDFWGYKASTSADRLELYVADWYAVAVEGSDDEGSDDGSVAIAASVGDKRLELNLTPTKPVVLHGNPPGIQSMGPGGVSYYLSYPRMKAEGKLYTDCTPFCTVRQVRGQAWHDHQWGDFDLASYAGWDWFSLQFDNNTELMLYLIRQPNGDYSAAAGTFVTASGRSVNLEAQDFVLKPTGRVWKSPATGAVYPLGWRVSVPRFGVDTLVTPRLLEQEMDTRASTGIVYWEGAVTATGTSSGLGYVELTNYDRYPYGQTDDTTPLQPLSGPFGQR
ncbi:lipocalin-like domain-containing protein [soil metagenome]